MIHSARRAAVARLASVAAAVVPVVVAGVLVAALPVALAAPTPAGAAATSRPASVRPSGAGAFFVPGLLGLAPALGLPHFCSGAAVAPDIGGAGDLVLTAAHCMFGTGLGMEFAPGYRDGATPSGVWDVDRVYLDSRWLADRDPRHDVAVVHVVPHGELHLSDVVQALPVGTAPAGGGVVHVLGYPWGFGPGASVSCTAPVSVESGYPTVHCSGFTDGVSGGPWTAAGHLVGVTGGLNHGGCVDTVTHTAPFGAQVRELLARAAAAGPGDLAPVAFADGC